jgi:formyltetrahydrofolate-dependent phosphoribosylglycinamide formyltransferase
MAQQLPTLSAGSATVLGFGGRAPTAVLELVASLPLEYTIALSRSSRFVRALSHAPYRRFLQAASLESTLSSSATTQQYPAFLVYQIPSSVIEYIQGSNEAAFVRAALLDCTQNTVVVLYDPTSDTLLGGTMETILLALTDDAHSESRTCLTCAALQALAALDAETATWVRDRRHRDVVIVVGNGGREHALAVQLAQSPAVGTVICCPGNGGTATAALLERCDGGKIVHRAGSTDKDSIVQLCRDLSVTMVVVGPEQPLVDGLVDALHEACPTVLAFGPTQAAAQLEASKAFSKDFLQAHGIATASYRNFTVADEAVAYIQSLDIDATGLRQVVKASGLAAGKGVLLPETEAATIGAVHEIMSDKAFGAAGDTCVIESFLTGPEASCLAFCDGETAILMPAAQDHKRALDNDEGLNTGGMGAYAPAPCVTPLLQEEIQRMCQTTVSRMKDRGTPYVGVLYAGMMLTPNGPYVLEFNCRFGDPETQVLLPLLETDLYEIMTACCKGELHKVDVRFKEGQAAATVVCAAAGYPQSYPKGMIISGLPEATAEPNVKVYHAGTALDADHHDASGPQTVCTGGRVLAVTGTGSSLQTALKSAYNGVDKIQFLAKDDTSTSLMHFRTDIGRKAVEKKLRIGVMGSTRGTALLPVMEACANGELHAEIVAVLSNKESAPILEKGRTLGPTVLTQAISSKGLTREQFDAECTASLVGAGVDYVLLVGYMRILSKSFTDFWAGRCINVHPSLLPKHAGGMDLAVHQAVIDAKEEESGCTIHLVTEAVDGGPIVVQKRVKVDPGETAESLKAKVQPLEGPAFVEAIQLYCRGTVISYADAGVSIDAGNKFVDMIKPFCKATRRAGCDADLGGFGGMFDLAAAGYNAADTVLIGATDGVGTKLRIAQLTGKHETVGIDLVAMCVNDLVVAGGEPLFFLDYFATGHLDVEEAASVVKGIAAGCKESGCGLIGGETAEMPSMYAPGDYDLAGFTVGAVYRDRILPQNVSEGDVLLGISSSGIHSNGFSLVRKLVEKEGLSYDSPCPWDTSQATVGDALLTPTKIYVKSCLPLIKQNLLKGLAHITGGGLLENLPRSLPVGLTAEITSHPPLPPVFKWMRQASGLDDTEMLRTFNCGIGMVLILSPENVETAVRLLAESNENDVFVLGSLIKGAREVKMSAMLV